ncbi:hypothetical protein KFU94_43435 [Chloroflexi bacterium TSY]|nr:hypothetical protein [Chloroflexi bacterium TSY]
MALSRLTQQVMLYEVWGEIELDPRLRRAIVWSGITSIITLLALLNLPLLWQWSRADFWLLLRPQLQAAVLWCAQMQRPLLIFNVGSVVVYVVLLILTHQLQRGRLWVLRVGWAQSIIGALNGAILTLTLAVIVVNIIAWIVMTIIVIMAIGAALSDLGK